MGKQQTVDYSRLQTELLRQLRLYGPASASDLRNKLELSQPTFSRLVKRCQAELLVLGKAQRTRYAVPRSIPGLPTANPVYIAAQSPEVPARRLCRLHAIEPKGFWAEGLTSRGDDVFDQLPYFLADLRPSGFLGRLVPRLVASESFPENLKDWSDDHVLRYLTQHGWNATGNLIVGDVAFQLYLEHSQAPTGIVTDDERARRYPELAADVLAWGEPGASAAGEQPKFLVMTQRDGHLQPALVKFSPPITEAVGRRVADLLVAEHLAHQVLVAHGLPAAASDVFETTGQMFLEVERFDRQGAVYRSGMITLEALDGFYVGGDTNWLRSTAALAACNVLDGETLRQVRWLSRFGHLIANSDMHAGNLAFSTRDGLHVEGLAPVYDMTPMRFMPQHGHMPTPELRPSLPTARDADIESGAQAAARDFWARVAEHPLVSAQFQRVARSGLESVRQLAGVLDLLPR